MEKCCADVALLPLAILEMCVENVNGKSPAREGPKVPLPVSSWNKKALI